MKLKRYTHISEFPNTPSMETWIKNGTLEVTEDGKFLQDDWGQWVRWEDVKDLINSKSNDTGTKRKTNPTVNPIFEYLDGFDDEDDDEDDDVERGTDLTGRIQVYIPTYQELFDAPFREWEKPNLTIGIGPESNDGDTDESMYESLEGAFSDFHNKYIKGIEWGISENLHEFYLNTSEEGWDSPKVHDEIVQNIIEHLRKGTSIEVTVLSQD